MKAEENELVEGPELFRPDPSPVRRVLKWLVSLPNKRRVVRVSDRLRPDESVLFTGPAHWIEWSSANDVQATGHGILVVTDQSLHYANDFDEDLKRTIRRADLTEVDVKPFAHVFQLILETRDGETYSFAGRANFLYAVKYDLTGNV